jgi:thiamine pyrophosphate-dependent acetolactate synthase large subunit-like protein
MTMTCGEATIRLLSRYGVSHVFGIPRRSYTGYVPWINRRRECRISSTYSGTK